MITGDCTFHRTEDDYRKYSDDCLKNAISSNTISQDDANLIKEFIVETQAISHISVGRAYKLEYQLIKLCGFIGPFLKASPMDVYAGIDRLKSYKQPKNDEKYSQITVIDMVKLLKRFYIWLYDNGKLPEDYKIEKIRKIKGGTGKTTKTAEQLLSQEEVKRMIEETPTSRDRALIAVLYDSGCRVGELATMNWNQVKYHPQYAILNTDAKTGKGRTIRLGFSVPYLKQWQNDYPGGNPGPDDLVFCHRRKRGQMVTYHGTAKMLKGVAERAGINKRFTPHLFRHSRVTDLLQEGYSEPYVKMSMWGSMSTNMLSTYSHLVDVDLDDEFKRKTGIEPEKKPEDSALHVVQCPHCAEICPPTATHCPNCWKPLTEAAQETQNNLIEMLGQVARENPEALIQALKGISQ